MSSEDREFESRRHYRTARRQEYWKLVTRGGVAPLAFVALIAFGLQVTDQDNKGQTHALRLPGTPETTQPSGAHCAVPPAEGILGHNMITGDNWAIYKAQGWKYYGHNFKPVEGAKYSAAGPYQDEGARVMAETCAISVAEGYPFDPETQAPLTEEAYEKLKEKDPEGTDGVVSFWYLEPGSISTPQPHLIEV